MKLIDFITSLGDPEPYRIREMCEDNQPETVYFPLEIAMRDLSGNEELCNQDVKVMHTDRVYLIVKDVPANAEPDRNCLVIVRRDDF